MATEAGLIIGVAGLTVVLVTSIGATVIAVIALNRVNEVARLHHQFVANVSHELRTPLGVIWGYTQMAIAGDLPPEMAPMVFEKIHKAGARMKWLIDNALYTVTLTNGDIEMGPLNLGDIAQEAVADMITMLPEAKIEAMLASNALVSGSRRLLYAAITNLLDNAVKFSSKDMVSVCVERQGKTAVVIVRDSGIGISPEMQHIIFQPFRQGDGSDTRPYGGVGIGLWIVNEVARRHNGQVLLESEVEQGSTFRLILPVHDE